MITPHSTSTVPGCTTCNPSDHLPSCTYSGDEKEREAYWTALSRAWVFGDKILDHDFCDAVVDSLIALSRLSGRFPYGAAYDIYKAASSTTPARQFLIDMFLHVAHEGWFDTRRPAFDTEAYKEITRRLVATKGVKLSKEDAPWNVEPCVYHWHKKDGGICYKARLC